MSSGRTHLANIAFCLGDNGNFPHLSLGLREKKIEINQYQFRTAIHGMSSLLCV